MSLTVWVDISTENVIVQPCLNFNYIDQAYLCHDLWTYHRVGSQSSNIKKRLENGISATTVY